LSKKLDRPSSADHQLNTQDDASIFEMEFNDATPPTGRLCVVFRFWPMGSEARHGPWCTLTTEAKGRFHYAAATVTVAVPDTFTYRLSGSHCRRPTIRGSQR
jgi:hypothetical protein